MTVYFMDSSALVKRYLAEVGSAWVRAILTPSANSTIIVSRLAEVEVWSAFERRFRSGTISTSDLQLAGASLLVHLRNEYLVVFLNMRVVQKSRGLLSKHPLRTLDALQLAASLVVPVSSSSPLTFVSADNILLGAASGEGLLTDNPMLHP